MSDEGLATDLGLVSAMTIGIGTVIGRLGADDSLVLVGATDRGLLSRIVHGTPALDTIERLDTPVLLTERPASRSLRERLFGRR